MYKVLQYRYFADHQRQLVVCKHANSETPSVEIERVPPLLHLFEILHMKARYPFQSNLLINQVEPSFGNYLIPHLPSHLDLRVTAYTQQWRKFWLPPYW